MLHQRHKKTALLAMAIFAMICNSVEAQTPNNRIGHAYRKNSFAEISAFFNDWQKNAPTSIEKNDTTANIVSVYQAVYNHIMDSFSIQEKMFDTAKYYYVQQSLSVYLTDKKFYYTEAEIDSEIIRQIYKIESDTAKRTRILKRSNGRLSQFLHDNLAPSNPTPDTKTMFLADTITDFLYQVNTIKPKLFYKPSYYKILYNFLAEGTNNQYGSPEIDYRRNKFIAPYLNSSYNHYDRPYIISSPYLTCIIFDIDYTTARVDFEYGNGIYQVLLTKVSDGWKLKECRKDWIQY